MSIKALVFDFGGVISKTLFETHPLTESELGLPLGSLQWQGPFDPQRDDVWRKMQAGEISERDYWLHRAKETGALVGENWDSMQSFVKRARGSSPMDVIRPEFLSCIEKAKDANIRLAILSNELDLFYGSDFRERLPFLQDFELIVDATYTHILKPDAKAYAFITEGLMLKADECFFVDDQQRNIEGATAIGMQTHTFNVLNPSKSYLEIKQALNIN